MSDKTGSKLLFDTEKLKRKIKDASEATRKEKKHMLKKILREIVLIREELQKISNILDKEFSPYKVHVEGHIAMPSKKKNSSLL